MRDVSRDVGYFPNSARSAPADKQARPPWTICLWTITLHRDIVLHQRAGDEERDAPDADSGELVLPIWH